MTTFSIYANGTFWGTFEADSADAAIQMAADKCGTVDVGNEHASTDRITAAEAYPVLDDCTHTAEAIGQAATEAEAQAVFSEVMSARAGETISPPSFALRRDQTVVDGGAWEPIF